MTTASPTSAAEAVANGAQLLDDKHPGWWRKINLKTLMLSSCRDCVCGQLAASIGLREEAASYSPWNQFFHKTGATYSWRYGFYTHAPDWHYDDLDREWKQVIQARLEADTLSPRSHQTLAVLNEDREEVLA